MDTLHMNPDTGSRLLEIAESKVEMFTAMVRDRVCEGIKGSTGYERKSQIRKRAIDFWKKNKDREDISITHKKLMVHALRDILGDDFAQNLYPKRKEV